MSSDADVFTQTQMALFWAFLIIPLVLAFGGMVVYLINFVSTANLDAVEEMEEKVYEMRMLYSSHCLAYEEQGGRTKPGFISQDRFTKDVLMNCLDFSQRSDPALRMSLEYREDGETQDKIISSENWELKDIESSLSTNEYYVLVNGEKPGKLRFLHKP